MKIGYGSWLGATGLKSQVVINGWSLFYSDESASMHVYAIDGVVVHETRIFKDGGADQVDFDTNFKALANKPLSQSPQPFASKTLVNGKALFKRLTGISFAVTAGSNNLTWTQSACPLVKILGIEVINAEIGDICSFYILDSATGAYSGIANYPLNQFAFNVNIAPGYYRYASEYDSDLYQNLQIKFVYNSVSAKTIYINLDMNEVK